MNESEIEKNLDAPLNNPESFANTHQKFIQYCFSAQQNYGRVEKTFIYWLFKIAFPKINLKLQFSENDLRQTHAKFTDQAYTLVPPKLKHALQMVFHPNLMFGRHYMLGHWHVKNVELSAFIHSLTHQRSTGFVHFFYSLGDRRGLRFLLKQRWFPKFFRLKSRRHYNIGLNIYNNFLDINLNYSCAFFDEHHQTLKTAQNNKIQITIRRLQPDEAGQSFLDIGCGWGNLTRQIVQSVANAKVVGLTISSEQYKTALQKKKQLGLAEQERLSYHCMNYEKYRPKETGLFDRVVSVGMFEHVGLANYTSYFRFIKRMLKPNGIGLIHSIVSPGKHATNIWVDRYIFPGGYIPAYTEMIGAAAKSGLDVDQVFLHAGENYRRTLQCWKDNFYQNFLLMKSQQYDKQFLRMWDFYLSISENSFNGPFFTNLKVMQLRLRKVKQT